MLTHSANTKGKQMIENIYYNRCRIKRVRVIATEPNITYECDSLPQPFEVFTPSVGRDFLNSDFAEFEWMVRFSTSGQPTRTDLREKTVVFRKEYAEIQPTLTRGAGQIVAFLPGKYQDENDLVVDIGPGGPFYVFALNRDLTLKIGDWVELEPRHPGGPPDLPLMSAISQATRVIKNPKD